MYISATYNGMYAYTYRVYASLIMCSKQFPNSCVTLIGIALIRILFQVTYMYIKHCKQNWVSFLHQKLQVAANKCVVQRKFSLHAHDGLWPNIFHVL